MVVEPEGRAWLWRDSVAAVPNLCQLLPWDVDLDFQVSETTLGFLARYYNMTEYRYDFPGANSSRAYLLDINPHYTVRGVEDSWNVIDGRWIDTETGLFIDITAVRQNDTAVAEGIKGALMCKDRHHYLVSPVLFDMLLDVVLRLTAAIVPGTRPLPPPG